MQALQQVQVPVFVTANYALSFDALRSALEGLDGPTLVAPARATVGDAVIMLLAYGVVAVVVRSRSWILASKGWQLSLLVAIGVSITAGIEWLATRGYWMASWNYLPTMPLAPGTDIGLVPLLQWIVLPLLTVWFVRRQLPHRGQAAN